MNPSPDSIPTILASIALAVVCWLAAVLYLLGLVYLAVNL